MCKEKRREGVKSDLTFENRPFKNIKGGRKNFIKKVFSIEHAINCLQFARLFKNNHGGVFKNSRLQSRDRLLVRS